MTEPPAPEIVGSNKQVNAKSTTGVTALQQAAAEGHADIVDLLLNAGASVNAHALSNTAALYNAANGGHLEIARRLLKAGAEADAKTGTGSTPLHAAASGGFTPVRRSADSARASALSCLGPAEGFPVGWLIEVNSCSSTVREVDIFSVTRAIHIQQICLGGCMFAP